MTIPLRAIPGEVTEEREPALILDPRQPLLSARAFLVRRHTTADIRTLHHHRGEFFTWDGTAYRMVDDAEIRAELYEFLDFARLQPNRAKVGDVLDALKAVANLEAAVLPPRWLKTVPGFDAPAGEYIVAANGLLHLPTRELHPATPALFSTNALPVPYDALAPEPKAWLAFLESVWPNDKETIETLQEIFGYVIASDTRQQKMFLIVGPRRSGKGTIARTLTALVGTGNVASPTLASLQTNFGLQPLIGKMLATITDARLSGRADQSAIAERLLSVSGEDHVTIDRKFLIAWTGRLPTRFLILTNVLPQIADASGALASRFVVLVLTQSFYGRENLKLWGRIAGELPGVFAWSLAGLDRLCQRGYFRQPQSSRQAVEELDTLGAPVTAFVNECCITGPGRTCEVDTLFRAWQNWCTANGRRDPGTKQGFGGDLRAAVPGLGVRQPRAYTETGRVRVYEGIGLK